MLTASQKESLSGVVRQWAVREGLNLDEVETDFSKVALLFSRQLGLNIDPQYPKNTRSPAYARRFVAFKVCELHIYPRLAPTTGLNWEQRLYQYMRRGTLCSQKENSLHRTVRTTIDGDATPEQIEHLTSIVKSEFGPHISKISLETIEGSTVALKAFKVQLKDSFFIPTEGFTG